MKPFDLLLLILCNVVWGLNPVVSKVLMRVEPSSSMALVRVTGACIFLTFFYLIRRRWNVGTVVSVDVPPPRGWDYLFVLLTGFLTFFGSPWLQGRGMETTSAAVTSILVGLEPLFTVFAAIVIFRERLTLQAMIALVAGVYGFFLLSQIHETMAGLPLSRWFQGDLLVALAVVFEALYSIFGRMIRMPGPSFLYYSLLVGAVFHWSLAVSQGVFPSPETWGVSQWFAVLWLGPIGSAIPYLIWVVLLSRGISLAAMAMTLFVQPVVGAVFGYTVLGEHLSLVQWAGGGLILLGAYVVQLPDRRGPNKADRSAE